MDAGKSRSEIGKSTRKPGKLTEDIEPLLLVGIRFKGPAIEAFNRIWNQLIVKLEAGAWKSTDATIAELRGKKYPTLLR